MGLKTKKLTEKAILRHEDANAKHLYIGGVTHLDIVDKINAFDWLDLGEAKNEAELAEIILRFFRMFNFTYPPAYESIILKAFTAKFMQALDYIRQAIIDTNQSYNVEGSSRGFQNATVNKFYYINYWADKKSIPVNYNEKKQADRELFNLDTIILSILADKLNVFNEFERNKPKSK